MKSQVAVLLISNGNAEDLIGAKLFEHLYDLGIKAQVLPLVGEGSAYKKRPGITLAGPLTNMPSGGFPLGNFKSLVADLQAGFIRTSLRQWLTGLKVARKVGLVVVVGDAYALLLGALAARMHSLPFMHVQPLVSAHYMEGLGLLGTLRELNALGANMPMPYEVQVARRARAVFVRDRATADLYSSLGIPARFAGSFAMDILNKPERDLADLIAGKRVLALVPGSREDHRYSLPIMLSAAAKLPKLAALVAWSHSWDQVTLPQSWRLELQDNETAWAAGEGVRVALLKGAFGAIARNADVAIGTSGTANEQLAGLGVPIIAFPTQGPQFTVGFARRQQRLLGDALCVVRADPNKVVEEVKTFLSDGARFTRAAHAGISRAGLGGALVKVACKARKILAMMEGY